MQKLIILFMAIMFMAFQSDHLPNVLIIGDSISIGYTPFVKAALKGKANVVHNPGNAQHTGTGLAKLDEWLGDTRWDIIHFNWGLWDLAYRSEQSKVYGNRDKINGTVTLSPEEYGKNLEELVIRLKNSGAKLIFATTSYVPRGEAGRVFGDDVRYNRVAKKIMKRHDVQVNDLNRLSKRIHLKHKKANGDVHFTPEGYKLLALPVIEAIERALSFENGKASQDRFIPGADAPGFFMVSSDSSFNYNKISGIGHESGVTRRDPSDVIKVGNTCYVYYTKVFGRAPGYWGTIWMATSNDEGFTWEEKAEVLGVGQLGAFDSQAVFTPNIMFANGKYYLYYTGVKPTPGNEKGEFENNSVTDITAIGLAMADSPDGPFVRVSSEPVLEVSHNPDLFDSYRIDDASLLFRDGKYWLYYKGRSRKHGEAGPGKTQMGVAFSENPEGPFRKYGKPILSNSHEVLIWPQGEGVAALASLSSTLEYAPDGLTFDEDYKTKVKNRPNAPGLYRPDLTGPVTLGAEPDWGISMVHNGNECYLVRWSFNK